MAPSPGRSLESRPNPSLCVLGVDFRVKNLLVDNKCYALQLWDTAGQERYDTVYISSTSNLS